MNFADLLAQAKADIVAVYNYDGPINEVDEDDAREFDDLVAKMLKGTAADPDDGYWGAGLNVPLYSDVRSWLYDFGWVTHTQWRGDDIDRLLIDSDIAIAACNAAKGVPHAIEELAQLLGL